MFHQTLSSSSSSSFTVFIYTRYRRHISGCLFWFSVFFSSFLSFMTIVMSSDLCMHTYIYTYGYIILRPKPIANHTSYTHTNRLGASRPTTDFFLKFIYFSSLMLMMIIMMTTTTTTSVQFSWNFFFLSSDDDGKIYPSQLQTLI